MQTQTYFWQPEAAHSEFCAARTKLLMAPSQNSLLLDTATPTGIAVLPPQLQ